MCHVTPNEYEEYYDERGNRLFTAEQVLKAAGSLGHTSGRPEEQNEQERILATAMSAYTEQNLRPTG